MPYTGRTYPALERVEKFLESYLKTSPNASVYSATAVAEIIKEAEKRGMDRAALIARNTEPPRRDFEGYADWGSFPNFNIADKILDEAEA